MIYSIKEVKMKVDQFKKLIKESIKEVLVEDGLLKDIVKNSITEATSGLTDSATNLNYIMQLDQLKEMQASKDKPSQKEEDGQAQAIEEITNRGQRQIEKMQELRDKMMQSIGKSSYKDLYNLEGVDLFEGTTPLGKGGVPGQSASGQGPLSGVEPDDAGVAIDNLLGNKKLWQQLMKK
jgi:predicted transcriptional regulator